VLLANSLNVTVSHVLLQYKNNVKNDKIICVLKFYVKRVKYQFVFYLNTVNNFLEEWQKIMRMFYEVIVSRGKTEKQFETCQGVP
jgi:hypothetical protein